MPIAFLSPLPPIRSGISVYAEMLLPALAERMDVIAVGEHPARSSIGGVEVLSLADYQARRTEFEISIYQMGNNPHHEWIYSEAMERPGVLVLHDLVLHHLIVEMTLARGLASEYVKILEANHGAIGEAWARGRAAGYHDELGNFLLPASRAIAQRSRSVIVHNRYAADQLRLMGVDRPVTIAPMSFEATVDSSGIARTSVRKQLGYSDRHRVIGMFGFVTASKRPEVVLEAFASAVAHNQDLRLLIVGEPAPNCDLRTMIAHFGIDESLVHLTGYVPEEMFDGYLSASDRVVNLRYPTAGETSGALLRIFATRRPVAVSHLAQFLEFPDDVARKIPLGPGEVEALRHFILEAEDFRGIADAQRNWLARNGAANETVDAYVAAIAANIASDAPREGSGGIPLFPDLRLTGIRQIPGKRGLSLTVRNEGASTLRAAVFGSPGYRMIVKLFDREGNEILDRWLPLERDLHAGEETTLSFTLEASVSASEMRLHHALESIPTFDATPFATRSF